jgi:transcription elongation factor Elf1
MIEHFFQCPYCWEEVSVLLDPSSEDSTYIEDCEVCCNPLQFTVGFNNSSVLNFTVEEFQ